MVDGDYDPTRLASPTDTPEIRAARRSLLESRCVPGYDLEVEARAMIRLIVALEQAQQYEEAYSAEMRIERIAMKLSSQDFQIQDMAKVKATETALRNLSTELVCDGRDSTARRVDRIANEAVKLIMEANKRAKEAKLYPVLDDAIRAAALAREAVDVDAEIQAMSTLANIFLELGRENEAAFCEHETARLKAAETTSAQRPMDLSRADGLVWGARAVGVRPGVVRLHDFEQGRGACYALGPGASFEVELLVGYIAVKLIGPFLEAFATTLGKQFGESTGRALGRLRVMRSRGSRGTELDVDTGGEGDATVSKQSTTTLVLPDPLTDEARLAFLDLDMTDSRLRNVTLYWDDRTRRWEKMPDKIVECRRRLR
jgi:hypothetical protein